MRLTRSWRCYKSRRLLRLCPLYVNIKHLSYIITTIWNASRLFSMSLTWFTAFIPPATWRTFDPVTLKSHDAEMASEVLGCSQIILNLIISQGHDKIMDFSLVVLVSYLCADCPSHRHGEWPDIASAQVLPFPLVTEELQFSLLFIIQTVAVAYLDTQTSTCILKVWQRVQDGLLRFQYIVVKLLAAFISSQ